jgi:hypothetical protein
MDGIKRIFEVNRVEMPKLYGVYLVVEQIENRSICFW